MAAANSCQNAYTCDAKRRQFQKINSERLIHCTNNTNTSQKPTAHLELHLATEVTSKYIHWEPHLLSTSLVLYRLAGWLELLTAKEFLTMYEELKKSLYAVGKSGLKSDLRSFSLKQDLRSQTTLLVKILPARKVAPLLLMLSSWLQPGCALTGNQFSLC